MCFAYQVFVFTVFVSAGERMATPSSRTQTLHCLHSSVGSEASPSHNSSRNFPPMFLVIAHDQVSRNVGGKRVLPKV